MHHFSGVKLVRERLCNRSRCAIQTQPYSGNDFTVNDFKTVDTFIHRALIGTHRADGAETEIEPGIHHYGFMVDSLDKAVAKLPASLTRGDSPQVSGGATGPEAARPAEVRFIDPWGNNVDLSSRGFLGREEKRLPVFACSRCKFPIRPKLVTSTRTNSI